MKNLHEAYKGVYLKEAKISFDFENETPKTFSLKDVYAKQVLKTVNKYSFDVQHLIKQWVTIAGWDKSVIRSLKNDIIDAMNDHYDMEDEQIVSQLATGIQFIINNKENFYNFQKSLDTHLGRMNDFIKILISEHPQLNIFNNTGFQTSIINIKTAENNVSVGTGELFITLFSEGVKNTSSKKKGDIAAGEFVIEVKDSAGRAGKQSSTTASIAMRSIINDLSKIQNQINKEFIDIAKDTTKKIPVSLINNINKLPPQVPKTNNIAPTYLINLNKVSDFFNNINKSNLNRLVSAAPTDAAISQANSALNKYATITGTIIPDEYPLIGSYIKDIKNLMPRGAQKNTAFGQNLTNYFDFLLRDKNNNIDELVKNIKNFSTVAQKQGPQFDQLIKELITRSDKIEDINVLITSLQVAEYAEQENFDYFYMFNKSMKKIILEISESFSENVKNFHSFGSSLKISANTGGAGSKGAGGRGGFQITIK